MGLTPPRYSISSRKTVHTQKQTQLIGPLTMQDHVVLPQCREGLASSIVLPWCRRECEWLTALEFQELRCRNLELGFGILAFRV